MAPPTVTAMMRRTAVAALCGAALIATPAAVALAQDVDTGGVARQVADAACAGVLDARAGYDAAYASTDNGDDGPAQAALGAAEANLRTQVAIHVDYGNEPFTCDGPAAVFVSDVAPTPTPTPTPSPTPTPEPSPEPVPTLPPADDKNCADFPTQADAQAALDADTADPNRLDLDGDGVACELDDTQPDLDGDDFTQVGQAPRGGVQTGG